MVAITESFLHKIEQQRTYQIILLILITVVALALRLYKLGEWSFWGDEWYTLRDAGKVFSDGLRIPSMSLALTNLVLSAFGTIEGTARITAALIGILSVPIFYFPIKKMFDPLVALLSSLLLAVIPWHLYWSQNARFYTSLLLLFTIALFFFYFGLELDRPLYLLLSLAFLYLAFKERHIAAFLGPVAFCYVALLKLLRFPLPSGFTSRNLLLFFGPGALGGALLGYRALQGGGYQAGAFSFVNNNPLWIAGGVVFYIGIPLACMSGLGAWFLVSQKNRAGLLLTLGATVPLAAIMILSLMMYTANRYVFVSLTSIIILAAVAVSELLRRTTGQGQVLAAGLLLVMIAGAMGDNFLYFRYQNGNRDDWRSAYQTIAAQLDSGDRVIVTQTLLAEYYLQNEAVEITSMRSIDIDSVVNGDDRSWFLLDLTAPDKAPEVTRWVQRNANFIASFDVSVSARTFPMRVYLYDPEHHLVRND